MLYPLASMGMPVVDTSTLRQQNQKRKLEITRRTAIVAQGERRKSMNSQQKGARGGGADPSCKFTHSTRRRSCSELHKCQPLQCEGLCCHYTPWTLLASWYRWRYVHTRVVTTRSGLSVDTSLGRHSVPHWLLLRVSTYLVSSGVTHGHPGKVHRN